MEDEYRELLKGLSKFKKEFHTFARKGNISLGIRNGNPCVRTYDNGEYNHREFTVIIAAVKRYMSLTPKEA